MIAIGSAERSSSAERSTRTIGNREAFAELRAEIARAGLLKRPTGRILAEMALHLCITVAGFLLYFRFDGFLVPACGMIVATIGTLGVATNVHTASHGATSHRGWVNDLITYLGYPVFVGLSATAWRHSHIATHHRAPNVIGIDGDCELTPWFAITRPDFESSHGTRRTYYRWQVLALPLLLPLDGFNRQFGSWRWLVAALRDRDRRDLSHWLDFAAMSAYPIVWFAIPMAFLPVTSVLAFNAIRIALVGFALFAAFAPGHFPTEATCTTPDARSRDFLRRQLVSTLNFRTGPIARLFLSGLEFQIEHHLFPSVSHVHYPALNRIMVRYCEERGYPHRTYTWAEGLWKSVQVFITPKAIETAPEPDDIEAIEA